MSFAQYVANLFQRELIMLHVDIYDGSIQNAYLVDNQGKQADIPMTVHDEESTPLVHPEERVQTREV